MESCQPRNPNPLDVWIGSRVSERRIAVRMTQGQLAKGVGISFQQLQKYEAGRNRISASRLYEIAEFLGFAVIDFYPKSREETAKSAKRPLSSEERALLSGFQRLPSPKERQAVKGLITALSS